MRSYEEIIKEEIERTRYFTKKDFDKSIRALKIVRIVALESFLFAISLIPFLVGAAALSFSVPCAIILLATHYIFYSRYAKKVYDNQIADGKKELDTILEVVTALRDEKFKK